VKILHTADWHLGKRLGRIDRSDDLRRAVERVVDVCEREDVEVMVIAGDVFDNVYRADDVRAAVNLLKQAVGPFLRRGGTVLAVTGNHDGETFCNTLRDALRHLATIDCPFTLSAGWCSSTRRGTSLA
jgi:exonuclease SbcD